MAVWSYAASERFCLKKRNAYRTGGLALKVVGLACVSCVLAGCLGVGFATAAGGVSHDMQAFGISEVSTPGSASASAESLSDQAADASVTATSRLAAAGTRDISKGVAAIEAEEEAARCAAEEAQRAEDLAHTQAALANRDAQLARDEGAGLTGLAEVDWNVSKAEFVGEWTLRIDAYLAGSPLSGYGATFAEAAWENGVDPRFSPAISNTESTKGLNCFRSHNAWGWMGNTSWGSWNESINAHVQGLAKGYGYTISLANANKYCPPTYEDWYAKTLAQMQLI